MKTLLPMRGCPYRREALLITQTVWKLGAASAKQRVLPCEPRKVAQFRVKVLVFSFLWKILLLAFEEREFSHSLHDGHVGLVHWRRLTGMRSPRARASARAT